MTSLILSRARLVDFLECPRRFELRYLRQLAWPTAPLDEETAVSLQQGHQFHNLLERHFLHLPTDSAALPPTIANWYSTFQQSETVLPTGDYLPELTLTVPIGDHFLTGRFDLLVRETNVRAELSRRSRLHLFDWKTGRPRSAAILHADWQTRLYLAMVVESGQAISRNPIAPENVSITYWYVDEPNAPRHIQYDTAWHARNWAEIKGVVEGINGRLTSETSRRLNLSQAEAVGTTAATSTSSVSAISNWEKTAVLDHCRRCPYQIYCNRQDNPLPPVPQLPLSPAPEMEPESP